MHGGEDAAQDLGMDIPNVRGHRQTVGRKLWKNFTYAAPSIHYFTKMEMS
jgi:hypothetical protein